MGRSKRLTLIACILGSAIVFLDGTVVNGALPAIRDDLDADLAAQQWVVEAFLLTLGALLLIGGSLGDLFGRRRVFALGVGSFGVASLLCAVAPSAELLVAGRALQGVAGALLVPSTLALLMDTFEEGERGAAIGSWTAWTGIATVVGPFAGGVLIDAASWRWIFAINVPVVMATLWLLRHVRPDRPRGRVRIDLTGAVLAGLGLAGPVFALIEQPRRGFEDPLVLVPLAGGLALLALFVWWERRTSAPMLPLDLFRYRNFAAGNLATLFIYAGLGAALFFLVLFLQQVAGYSALEAGLALLPTTLVMFALSRRFGVLADRIGPRLLMGIGPLVAGGGLLLLLGLGAEADYVSEVLPAMLVFGLGLAITVAPLTATVLSGVDQEHSGLASGVNNAIARVAGLVAIAAVGAVVSTAYAAELDPSEGLGQRGRQALEEAEDQPLVTRAPEVPADERDNVEAVLRDASVTALHVGVGLAGALVVAGGLISLAGVRDPRRRVPAEECPGGAVCGASRDAARAAPTPQRVAAGAAQAGA